MAKLFVQIFDCHWQEDDMVCWVLEILSICVFLGNVETKCMSRAIKKFNPDLRFFEGQILNKMDKSWRSMKISVTLGTEPEW